MKHQLNFDELRSRLNGLNGPKYWRSLEELAQTDEFQALAEGQAWDANNPSSRRRFLAIMGASIALGAATACTKQPRESIVPYVRQPEGVVPGKPEFYATAMTAAGVATGLLVESHVGRPTKIEGNPDHPASLGSTDIFMQASVLTLYDPDRSQSPVKNGFINTWGAFVTELSSARDKAAISNGDGFRILTRTVTSPTLTAQIKDFLGTHRAARWHQWEPCGRHSQRAGSLAAFGQYWNTIYRFDRAERIVSLDADFLAPAMPGNLRYTRDYAALRRAAANDRSSIAPRLYMAESSPSITGGVADHRLRMRSSEVESFAEALLNSGGSARDRAIAKDLEQHRGKSIVIAGEFQPPRVHAIAHAINAKLSNVGATVIYTDPVEANPIDEAASIAELTRDMRAGKVQALLILAGNPVYDGPADNDFQQALKTVTWCAHVGLYRNETAHASHWHVPEAHFLESWSDARAYDGSASIVQPLIEPMYHGRTHHDVLNILNQQGTRSSHQTVQDYWRTQHNAPDFDDFWRTCLHDGVIAGSAFAEKHPGDPHVPSSQPQPANGLEITFRPDSTIGDGSFSNNAWLQELPKPANKMTWDNAIWISARTAQKLDLAIGDIVELSLDGGGRKVSGPCWIQPGQADDSLAVHFGYGRTHAGRVSDGIGFNAYALRTKDALGHRQGVAVKRISRGYQFAHTQHTQTMQDRDPIRMVTHDQPHENHDIESLFPLWPYPNHKWGMSIDLAACTGCNACMVACQSENNIAVVGKEQVAMGRHMNWIRVDRYFSGSLDDPEMYFQPVPCMHCENAPCELVCPVAATVHSNEGLNEMVYNRCVGTRYCSNNCPYKVRRFNFFLYSDWQTPSLWGLRNPDVSVRSRGVMEKCSYCVQRIERAKIDAQVDGNRAIRRDEIVTACQQACPAKAITFGDMNDSGSEIAKQKRSSRTYALLEELGTRPRTTYMARLRNPNSEIEEHA